jgi:hypothetical protein
MFYNADAVSRITVIEATPDRKNFVYDLELPTFLAVAFKNLLNNTCIISEGVIGIVDAEYDNQLIENNPEFDENCKYKYHRMIDAIMNNLDSNLKYTPIDVHEIVKRTCIERW